jgi:MarR family transcriptional regulator for hemolysin
MSRGYGIDRGNWLGPLRGTSGNDRLAKKHNKGRKDVKDAKEGDLPVAPTGHARDLDSWACYYHDYFPEGSRVDLEYRLSRMLVLAGRTWGTHIDNALRSRTGQSRARWQALFVVAFGKQPVTMTDIGIRLNVQWPTLVRVLDGLEKDALINRIDNPRDGRSRLVSITDEGLAMIRQIKPVLDEERGELLSSFSDEELSKCAQILQVIMDRAAG